MALKALSPDAKRPGRTFLGRDWDAKLRPSTSSPTLARLPRSYDARASSAVVGRKIAPTPSILHPLTATASPPLQKAC